MVEDWKEGCIGDEITERFTFAFSFVIEILSFVSFLLIAVSFILTKEYSSLCRNWNTKNDIFNLSKNCTFYRTARTILLIFRTIWVDQKAGNCEHHRASIFIKVASPRYIQRVRSDSKQVFFVTSDFFVDSTVYSTRRFIPLYIEQKSDCRTLYVPYIKHGESLHWVYIVRSFNKVKRDRSSNVWYKLCLVNRTACNTTVTYTFSYGIALCAI